MAVGSGAAGGVSEAAEGLGGPWAWSGASLWLCRWVPSRLARLPDSWGAEDPLQSGDGWGRAGLPAQGGASPCDLDPDQEAQSRAWLVLGGAGASGAADRQAWAQQGSRTRQRDAPTGGPPGPELVARRGDTQSLQKGSPTAGHVTPGHGGGAVRGSRWETVAELSAGACAAPRGPSRAASSGRGAADPSSCPDPGPVTGNWSLSCRDRGPCSRGAPQSALTVTVAFPEVWPREASVPHPARLLEVGLPSSCPPSSCPRLQLCPVGHCGFLN